MSNKINIAEPEEDLRFIDVHCHLPFPRPKNDTLPSDEEQYESYFKIGGVYLITCSIDMKTLRLILPFVKGKKNMGFTCGWAPQTVTYTPKQQYLDEWKKWIEYVTYNSNDFLAIGEVGLDFHHAKDLNKRNQQVEALRNIFEKTEDLGKPYVLHVRNATEYERDENTPDHSFNEKDGANREILKILKEFNIKPKNVMWHCFSGPEEYGERLAKQGFLLSVPSSSFGFIRWRKAFGNAPLGSLVTETDSYYQHPFKRGPVNVPSNARYSIAAIAHARNEPQKKVSKITVANAVKFFRLELL
ncbi:MAG: TatD family hydrolase [Candidatus Lokiarchaeota archaeon]|nr:TatD family hydrolase [Candidatus Lokiarchaeota archaeon]